MDFYKNRRWKIVSALEKITGFWPFQNRIKNGLICSLLFILFHSLSIPMILRLFSELDKNVHIVVENLVSIMLIFGTSLKLLAACCLQRRRAKMYSQLIEQLNKLQGEEVKIMTDYIEYGWKFTLAYIALAAIAVVAFDGPALYKTISSLFFSDTSTEKRLPYYLVYYVDHNKYYNYIVCHVILGDLCGTIVIFVYDLSFILAVQHSCALFEIITRRLKKALKVAAEYSYSQEVYTQNEYQARRRLIIVIDIHNETIQLVNSIDDAYNISWFFKLIETVVVSGGLLCKVIVFSTDIYDFIRFLMYLIFVLVQFNVAFNRGQSLIDLSTDLFRTCYNSKWETLSKDSISLLRMIMTQSSNINCLTGGKIFPLSNETYGKMLKTAFSYCTLFNSYVNKDEF